MAALKKIRRLLKGLFTAPDISWPLVGRVFYRNFKVFRKTWKTNIMFHFIEPVLYLWAMGFGLGVYVTDIQGLPYIQFLAAGLVASSTMFAVSYEMTYDSFTRMNYHKTFHAMVATPVSMDDVVMGEMIFGTFKGLLYGGVFFSVTLLFGLVQSPFALLLPVPLILLALTFSVLSLIWTSVAPSYDSFGYFFTLFISPMFLFSGVFFPVESLPAGVRYVAWATPLFHAVEVVRPLILGKLTTAMLVHLGVLTAFALLPLRVPLVMVKNRLIN